MKNSKSWKKRKKNKNSKIPYEDVGNVADVVMRRKRRQFLGGRGFGWLSFDEELSSWDGGYVS